MNYTFIDLQKQEKYKIIIPQIQRDYAQGREDKNNDNKIKSCDFILKLIDVLSTDNPTLNLDFVYGYTKEIAKNQFAFIPLDGQQRLTTLWLLHWYLSPKVEIEEDGIKMLAVSENEKAYLKNFTYETRNSSKRFCEELIDEKLPISDDVYTTIKDANWFMVSWLNDPTVVSMLNMIKTIQTVNFDKVTAWANLSENRKITFDYIDIKSDEFKLTDELYIKMNSRGKPLTSFENFKAQFSEILLAKDTDYYIEKLNYDGTQVTFQEYFAFKIDSVWTDLFWHFVLANEKDISFCFMNFFTYVAQMCYFKDNIGKKAEDFNLTNNDFNKFSVFKKKENVIFLFNTLDFFYKISLDTENQVCVNEINTLFNNIFFQGKINDSYQEQVRLFEDKEINLFEKCLLEGKDFDNRNRIILYCLISYAIKYNLNEANDELRYYIRVIRNLLQATRQRSETVYNTNVRINEFGLYWKLFNQLLQKSNIYNILIEEIDNKNTNISDRALNNEREKAIIITNTAINQDVKMALFKIEESEPFGGLIHQLKPHDNHLKFPDYLKAINDFGIISNELRIASLIACDFGGFYTKDCRLGEMFTFGNWNTIFTGEGTQEQNKKISKSILSLLDTYQLKNHSTTEDKLKSMILDKLKNLAVTDWQYYFLKYYDKMLKNGSYLSWSKDKFEHEILGTEGRNPLVAYHINPYVLTVSNNLDNKICNERYCYSIYSEESCLRLQNKISLYSKEDGWHILLQEGQTISDELKTKYNISEQNVFTETDTKDRIEIAVDFANDIFK